MAADPKDRIDLIVVMGVTACGKTTVGSLLAETLGWEFCDADDVHSTANVEKMARGEPLTESDRAGWLASLRGLIDRNRVQQRPTVVACPALRQAYRARLGLDQPGAALLFLRAGSEVIKRRLAAREGHFMPPALLPSQFATLEEPTDAIVLDATEPPEALIRSACEQLGLKP